ncbi:cysteine desulfurase [Xanthobacter tagetidis]|jgi:cysteine desulfurase/selenocysteine lyase|uniref:Cysteine desulfurase n=1 Tax=Xanthobacter tagetidis TaxID=60216 RepID=A0A3L7AEN0_9HYPH|nr:cysteine desulfurase [Xanthobacter tagetidis]MBB6305935.1 cysteine desulfurase/selenocysteine lyase [Xanthobacter tagetidis]RLP78455.1 cysteine desulfurase [Xanthobacter tagetidis]
MTATRIAFPPAAGGFDVAAVRADFPALAMTVNGHPLSYLDNAASAQKPRQVLERMTRAYESEYSNVHRGLHYLANAATEAFEHARETARAFLNAGSVDEIIFTRSGTGSINLVANSLGQSIEAGDEIVLSIMEHHSNIVPWHFLRERKGAVIKWAPLKEDDSFDLDAFKALLTERTKIVAITHMSNVLGTVTPVKEIVAAAHAVGAKVLVDGCQAVVHMPVDVRDLDVDFYAVTGHKLYGPTGIGLLYGKHHLLAEMPPYEGGGEMIREVTEEGVTYGVPPHRFEAGTPPIVQAIGLGAAMDYVASVGREAIAAYEHDLLAYAQERLGALNSLRIVGRAPGKGAIVSFEMKGAHPHDVATVLDRWGVAVRAGTHCAQPLLARYGATATCRASFALYNTRAEVDRLADALVKAQDLFA